MSAFPSVIELTALDGSNGFQINGERAYDRSGVSVSSAGDLNGDGFDDLVIGAPGADTHGKDSGNAYVVFGSSSGFGATVELSDVDGSNGFRLTGDFGGEFCGQSVIGAGDVNDDGITDLLIGVPGASPTDSNAGASFVLYGTTSGFNAEFDLNSIDGTNGVKIDGENAHDGSGWSVGAAGDFNGDGIADVVIGAYGADPNGKKSGSTYVVYGTKMDFSDYLLLEDLDGSNGFKINGEAEGDFSGRSVAGAGDVNGDGFADIVIGAMYASVNGTKAGAAYVVFGGNSAFASSLELSDLDGANGFKINGVGSNFRTGVSVASAGDFNGDGVSDLVIGARGAHPNGNSDSGVSYVVFGQSSGFSSSLDLSDLDGSNGFKISGEGAGDASGFSVASAGDFNGDGFSDIIIGAPYAATNGHNYSGAAYVVFGGPSGFTSNLQLSSLDGSNGFKIDGETGFDFAGFSVASAGDLNGDGLVDLVVGAYGTNPNGEQSGSSYVIYGSLPDSAVTRVGTDAANNIFGSDFADLLQGLGGADTLTGEGGNDTLEGGNQGDTLNGGSGKDSLYGGKGNDNLYGNSWNDLLQGNQGKDLLDGGYASDTLEGGSGNDTLIGGKGRDFLTGGPGSDTFEFKAAANTKAGSNRDHITDFTSADGDVVNLSHIDADTGMSGNQAFDFIGTMHFSGVAGELRYHDTSDGAIVSGDTTGNGKANFSILVEGVHTLTDTDFIL